MLLLTVVVIAIILAQVYAGRSQSVTEYSLVIDRQDIAPDGYLRSTITVNGQFPGPAIYANKGDLVRIFVQNNLEDGATIHWHGLHQIKTPWYDGAAGVTQCPIPAGESQLYEFTVDQAGTTWYHAHYKLQKVDGLWGPLIVRDLHDPHAALYDDEIVMTLADWYHDQARLLLSQFLSPASEGNEPIPDTGLINGINTFNCSSITGHDDACMGTGQRATFQVEPGKKYRIRVINTATFANFRFSVDEHPLTVIEADMTDVQPSVVTHFNINVAQRYSVVVEFTQADAGKAFWIRAEMSSSCFAGTVPPSLDPLVLGIFQVNGGDSDQQLVPNTSAHAIDASAAKGCIDLDPNKLAPVIPVSVNTTNVREIPIVVQFSDKDEANDTEGVTYAFLNNVSWIMPQGRANINQVMFDPNATFPISDNIYTLDQPDQWIRLVLINLDQGEHPFHLHGHTFQVVAWGTGTLPPISLKFHRIIFS